MKPRDVEIAAKCATITSNEIGSESDFLGHPLNLRIARISHFAAYIMKHVAIPNSFVRNVLCTTVLLPILDRPNITLENLEKDLGVPSNTVASLRVLQSARQLRPFTKQVEAIVASDDVPAIIARMAHCMDRMTPNRVSNLPECEPEVRAKYIAMFDELNGALCSLLGRPTELLSEFTR